MRQYEGLVTQHMPCDHKGRPYGGRMTGVRALGDDRFFTPLRCVQNDMWVEGEGKDAPVRGVGHAA